MLLEEYERYAVHSTPHADMYRTCECKGTTQKFMDAAGTQNFQPAPHAMRSSDLYVKATLVGDNISLVVHVAGKDDGAPFTIVGTRSCLNF